MNHPAEELLLRYSVDDLRADEAEPVRSHVEGCAQCGRLLASLADERAALLARTPPASLIASLERRRFTERRRRLARWAGGATALASAAAVLLLLARPPKPPLGLKGGGLTVYVKRGESVRLLGANDLVRPGDALRLVVTLDRQRLVRTWSIDDEGRTDALMPQPRAVDPGTTELPGSAVIDRPCVSGWLVVAVGDAARLAPPSGKREDRARLLSQLSEGGFTQRIACEPR
jgi:hypothetical protein